MLGASPDRMWMSRTGLMWALDKSDVKAVKTILDLDCNVNPADGHGYTAVSLAAIRGSVELTSLLLARGSSPNVPDVSSPNAAPLSSSTLDLSHMPSSSSTLPVPQSCPLLAAVASGSERMVTVLLENGATYPKETGSMLLWYAVVKSRNEALVPLLIDHGYGEGLQEVDAGDASNLLHAAAGDGCEQMVTALMQNDCDNHAGNQAGITPLMVAVRQGHGKVMKLLVASSRCDVNAMDKEGWTALHHALRLGQIDCAKWLIEEVPSLLVDLPSGQGHMTALFIASVRGFAPLVKCLLERGASVAVRDSFGLSPVEAANKFENRAVAEILQAAAGSEDH